jgi:hypothetical protein
LDFGFWKYSLGKRQLKKLSGFYRRAVGHLEMIPKPTMRPESIAFGYVELDRQ